MRIVADDKAVLGYIIGKPAPQIMATRDSATVESLLLLPPERVSQANHASVGILMQAKSPEFGALIKGEE